MSGIKTYAQFSDSPPRDVSLVTLSEAASPSPGWGLIWVQLCILGSLSVFTGKTVSSLPLLSPPLPPPITAEHQDGSTAALCYTQAHVPSHEEVLRGFRI